MNDEQKTAFAEDQAASASPQTAALSDAAAVIMPVTPIRDGADRKSLPVASTEDAEEEKTRGAWLNLASQDTLRRLWDTPEEEEAWRDLLKEI